MVVKTKFNIGDTISVVDNHSVIDFKIESIIIKKDGIEYRGESYKTYGESVCFSTRQELFDFIIGNTKGNEKTEEK